MISYVIKCFTKSELSKAISLKNGNEITWKGGVGLRFDDISDIGLFYTRNRIETLSSVQDGKVREANTYAYSSADLSLGKWNIQPELERCFQVRHRYRNSSAQLAGRRLEAIVV